jgi:ADP-dependent phosphofructokinase/glucokinase
MRKIRNMFDFLALLFGVRTRNNFEGRRSFWASFTRTLGPVIRLSMIVLVGGFVLMLLVYALTYNLVKERNTALKLNRLSGQIAQYYQTRAMLPAHLNEVVANDPMIRNNTFDSWGNRVVYQPMLPNQGFKLTSAGKDRKINTEDDIERLVTQAPAVN